MPARHGATDFFTKHKKAWGASLGGSVGLAGLLWLLGPDYMNMRDCQAGLTAKQTEQANRLSEVERKITSQWTLIGDLRREVEVLKATKADKH